MQGKFKAILFIIVFLLVVAVVCTFLVGRDIDPDKNKDNLGDDDSGSGIVIIDPSAPAATTVPPANTSVPTTAPTATPTQTPAPTPPPTQTPAPTQPPAALGSGSFSSDTGAKLNINAAWSARSISSSQVEVTVTVSLDSYAIQLAAVPYSVNIGLDGQYASLDAPAINYDGSALLNTTLATKTFTVDIPEGSSSSLHLAVEWHFGGSYGGIDLDVIECGGTISLSR